jgi:hypothetical protein
MGMAQHSAYPAAIWRADDRGHLAPNDGPELRKSRHVVRKRPTLPRMGRIFISDPRRELESVCTSRLSPSTPLRIITGVADGDRTTPNVEYEVTIPVSYDCSILFNSALSNINRMHL